MRVLVMGGTEFISLHLLRALQAGSHEVSVFNRGRQPDRLPAGVTLITGDRKDHAGLRERLAGRRFDAVYDVTYAPTLGEDVTALADALVGAPHLVFVSTCRVYDHALPIPYSEETARGLYWGDYARHKIGGRSEEHTSELQSRRELVCRLLLEKKNYILEFNQRFGVCYLSLHLAGATH